MALTRAAFVTLPSTPSLNALNWSAATTRAGKDPTTGDEWEFRSDGATSPIELYTRQAGGSWALKASDATTPYTGALTGVMSVCQDATNGAIHFTNYDITGVTNARGYGRATFTTSGGHITGYTWAATPFVLTTHTASSLDPRGQVQPVTLAGSEKLLYHISLGNSTTVTTYYTALSTSLTPSSAANFVGVDNVGSDTNTIQLTDPGTFGANHSLSSVIVQDPTTEDLYLVMGFQFTGDLANNTGSASSNLWYKRLARSGSFWTAPTATTAGTTIVGDNGSAVPSLMAVYPVPGIGAGIMYSDPANGVKFCTITGGTVTTVPDTPDARANAGGYGAFSMDANGRVYCIGATMLFNDATPKAFQAYYDLTKWTTFTDTGADTIAMCGAVPWAYGCSAIQERGSSVAQTNTGAFSATIFNSSPIITVQPQGAAGPVGGTATYSVTAVATVGSLSYQWKLNGSNVGTNSSSYTTGTLSSGDNGGTVTVDVTDSQGTTTSLPARLFVSGLPTSAKGRQFQSWAYQRDARGLSSIANLARKQVGAGFGPGVQDGAVAFNDWYFGAASADITLTLTGQPATFTPGAIGPANTLGLTGQAATFAAGAITPGVGPALTGQRANFAAGTLAPAMAVALTGQAATATAGTLAPAIAAGLTGQAATFAAGALTPTLSLALAGQPANFTPGTMAPAITLALVGQPATFTPGTITANTGSPDITLTLTGQAAAFTPGALAPATTVGLTGQPATFVPGTLAPAFAKALVGQGAAFTPGAIAPAVGLGLTGQAANFTPGNITANTGSPDITINLAGQRANFTTGTVAPALAASLTGAAAAFTPGAISPALGVVLAGQAAALIPGALTPALAVALSGQRATATPGAVTASIGGPDITLNLVGQRATFTAGNLAVQPDICVPTPPLQAVYIKLRAFLLTVVCDGAEVIQGLGNRVPMPAGPFVAMTAILQKRLNTNQDRYTDPFPAVGGSVTVQQNMRFDVQLDCYGPKAGDWAAVIATLLRDDYGCAALEPDCQPLYVDDPRQVPFVSGEEQYVQRWTLTAVLAYNPVTTLPQQFAGAAVVNLVLANQGP